MVISIEWRQATAPCHNRLLPCFSPILAGEKSTRATIRSWMKRVHFHWIPMDSSNVFERTSWQKSGHNSVLWTLDCTIMMDNRRWTMERERLDLGANCFLQRSFRDGHPLLAYFLVSLVCYIVVDVLQRGCGRTSKHERDDLANRDATMSGHKRI